MCVPICIRLLSVVAPVPPLETAKVPVEMLLAFKLVNPDPEPLNVSPCTVPEKVGFVFKTTLPEPVLVVVPVPPLATAKVPRLMLLALEFVIPEPSPRIFIAFTFDTNISPLESLATI